MANMRKSGDLNLVTSERSRNYLASETDYKGVNELLDWREMVVNAFKNGILPLV